MLLNNKGLNQNNYYYFRNAYILCLNLKRAFRDINSNKIKRSDKVNKYNYIDQSLVNYI
jgi:hypothetical protein